MTRFYLSGQNSFSNRGCEAIVRSTVKLINQVFESPEILVPSNNIESDRKQWPEYKSYGVEFVPDEFPSMTRFWAHFQRLPCKLIKQAHWPFGLSERFRSDIESVDVVMSVGGDNYSLDYRLPSLLVALDQYAQSKNKVSVLFGASVGPFEKEPDYVPFIQNHLQGFHQLWVRESVSQKYLTETLKLNNVHKMADPAFNLDYQETALDTFWPTEVGDGVLGVNISPLIEKYTHEGQASLREQTVEFIKHVLNTTSLSVVLVPHVIPLDHSTKNNDAVYMAPMLETLSQFSGRVGMISSDFNAAQLKYAIRQLRFFIGARTHATIAALSSQVPTISISYSVKAKGINVDLFGEDTPVLPTNELSTQSLVTKFDWLMANEETLKQQLSEKIPLLQKSGVDAIKKLESIVEK